jgi:hypothetical protein
MAALDTVLESVVAQSLQDFRALSVRAQESAASLHGIALSNALALQHQASLRALQFGYDTAEVAAAYRGSHLKSASEVDVQQATSEGQVMKDSSQASLPITQAQNSSNFNDQALKSVVDAVLAQVLTKLAQSTPPQSGGHAAEAPGGLK